MINTLPFSDEILSTHASIEHYSVHIISDNAERSEQRDQVLHLLLNQLNAESESAEHLG